MEGKQVILVDQDDRPIGTAGKMEAHEKGLLHRAFSVFIFNSKGEMLLQKRAMDKYHSGGLWSNACCSHPVPGEEILLAAQKRLKEEMGFEAQLEKLFDFIYEVKFDNHLKEHEFDHVFVGEYDGEVSINKEEASDFCFKDVKEISQSLQTHPQEYTAWFRLAFPKAEQWWSHHYKIGVV